MTSTRAPARSSSALAKPRSGSYFPEWLLQRRRRAEQALVTVVATSYVLGVSTRWVERLCEALGIDKLSKSQVSQMARSLDEAVAALRNRPLDAGPCRFCCADALVVKVYEILGLEVSSEESGAGWLGFFRGLVARGLSGVRLITSDARAGLVVAIGATLAGATWQRCRTHYLRDLLAKVAKSTQSWVATLVRTVFSQPDAAEVHAQFDRVVAARQEAPRRRHPPRRHPGRPARLYRLPPRGLAPVLVQQSPGTPQAGDQAQNRRRRYLPRPSGGHSPHRRRACRAARRVGRPLPQGKRVA